MMLDKGFLRSKLFFGTVLGCTIIAGSFYAYEQATETETGITLAEPWDVHTVTSGLDGSDGVDLVDIDGDGDLDVVSGYESSHKVTLSLNPGIPHGDVEEAWPSVTLPTTTVTGPEDAVFADVDEDGYTDIVVGGEGGNRITILFSPTSHLKATLLTAASWTKVEIDASVGQKWMRIVVADIDDDGVPDILGGGKEGSSADAEIAWFESATPRTAASWTAHTVAPCGWVMSLYAVDVDADGDLDIVYSDRDGIDVPAADNTKLGVRWYESDGAATPGWTAHQISALQSEWKFIDLVDWDGDGDTDVVGCRSNTSGVHNNTIFLNQGSWATWSSIAVAEPLTVGDCQDVKAEDIDEDGELDLVFTYSGAGSPLSGVVWLRNTGTALSPSWARGEIDGGAGVKYDNVELKDLDGDTDLDAVTSEQYVDTDVDLDTGPGLAVIWYENPLLTPVVIAEHDPVAAFSCTPTLLAISCTDSSTDDDGEIVSYAWTFGDASTSTSQNPSHTYAGSGTYSVGLTVTDDDGRTNTVSHNVTVSAPTVPTDGPAAVYRPLDNQDWTDLGLPVPTYWYLGQDASGNMAEVNGSTVLTKSGTSQVYQQTVTGWTSKFLGWTADAASNNRWVHATGVGIDPSATSIAILYYMAVEQGAAARRWGIFGASGNDLRIATNGTLTLSCNSVTTNGTTSHSDLATVRPYLLVHDRTNSRCRLYTTVEQINGTYGATADGNKGVGHSGATQPKALYNLVAIWSGANAEGLGKATLSTLGWTVAY